MVELHGEPYGLWAPGAAVEFHGEPSSQLGVVSPYGALGGTLPERISGVPKLFVAVAHFFPLSGVFFISNYGQHKGPMGQAVRFSIRPPPLPVQFSPISCLWGHMGGAGTPLRNTSPPLHDEVFPISWF